jgi:hypothetical protein
MNARAAAAAQVILAKPTDPKPRHVAQSRSTSAMTGQLRALLVRMTIPSPTGR